MNLKRCSICGIEDMPPDIAPYCVGGGIKDPVHSWAHSMCVAAVMAAKRAEAGPVFPTMRENGDGV